MAKKVPYNEATRDGGTISVYLVKRAEPPVARELRFYYHIKEGIWVPSVPGYNTIESGDLNDTILLKAVVAEVDAKDLNATRVAEKVKPVQKKKPAAAPAQVPADDGGEEYVAERLLDERQAEGGANVDND